MKITAQRGRGEKIHILIDGEYRLTVTRDFWAGQNIRSGDELDDAEFAAFCEAAGSCRAFNAAVDMLSRRDHSSKELERKVARRSGAEFARAAVERAMSMTSATPTPWRRSSMSGAVWAKSA